MIENDISLPYNGTAKKMFGHADGNSFYCSAETIYKPWLRERPIITASNNDICAIAMNRPAKALGVKMGALLTDLTDLIREHRIVTFSSHYELYGEVSNRMMRHFSQFVDQMEVYSIDEAFLDMTGFENFNLEKYGREIIRSTARDIRMPICLGIAPTKALAKAANKLAKTDTDRKGLYIINTESQRVEALKNLTIGDVWGIGGAYEKLLLWHGIENAYQFSCMSPKWVRKEMTVEGERLWLELNGVSCLGLELVLPDKKEVCTSRAFRHTVTEFEELQASVVRYLDSCARKLRKQGSYAQTLNLMIRTDNRKDKRKECFRSLSTELPIPTNNTLELIPHAMQLLKALYPRYRLGQAKYEFRKAGVTLGKLTPVNARQTNIFDTTNQEYRMRVERLQKVVDEVNGGMNLDCRYVRFAPEITRNNDTKLKRDMLSKNPLSDWEDRILISQCI